MSEVSLADKKTNKEKLAKNKWVSQMLDVVCFFFKYQMFKLRKKKQKN